MILVCLHIHVERARVTSRRRRAETEHRWILHLRAVKILYNRATLLEMSLHPASGTRGGSQPLFPNKYHKHFTYCFTSFPNFTAQSVMKSIFATFGRTDDALAAGALSKSRTQATASADDHPNLSKTYRTPSLPL